MATKETVVNQTPSHLAPVDDTVVIPESVKRAAALAESFYAKPDAQPDPQPQPDPQAAPAQEQAPPEPAPQAPAAPAQEQAPAAPETLTAEQWEHRYNSMKGRYAQSAQTIGQLQEQLSEMGTELVQTQNLLRRPAQDPSNPQPAQVQPQIRHLTPEDEANYGTDLVDVVKRAALDAVAPQLSAMEQENQRLKRSVAQQTRQTLYQNLAVAVPNWRDVNNSPRFKNWLRLRDAYSGGVRQSLLNTAVQAADAPRVIAFFKGFLDEERATGQIDPAPQLQPQAQPAARQAAVSLESLAAPGRAKPATGDTQTPVSKPVFTRAQIASFYNSVRQGAYQGRDADKARDEQAIFAAQSEGRVR